MFRLIFCCVGVSGWFTSSRMLMFSPLIIHQVDICNLASIKYDFVGYFERMETDVKKVVDRFGGEHLDIFNFGINAHFTNTDKRLARLYTKVSQKCIMAPYQVVLLFCVE